MKKILSAIAFSFSFFFVVAPASAIDSCADFIASIPVTQDWRTVQSIVDPEGFEWKRAIISRPTGKLDLVENEPLVISGIANPYSKAVIFIFNPVVDPDGLVLKPGDGTCFSEGTANEMGAFKLEMHSGILWGSLEQQLMIDAFYNTGLKPVERPKGALSTFSIGTYMGSQNPLAVGISDDSFRGDQKACENLCLESVYKYASEIVPDRFPDMARNSFDFPGGTPPNATASKITLAKSAGHTIHAFADRDEIDPATVDTLKEYARKGLVVEMIKRIVLGLEGGSSTIDAELTPQSIYQKSLTGDPSIVTFLEYLNNALSFPDGSPERTTALQAIANKINTKLLLTDTTHFVVTEAMMHEILPDRGSPATLPMPMPITTPPFTEQRTLFDGLDCPFNDFVNRKILKFRQQSIVPGETINLAKTDDIPITLEPGEYRILYASYDGHLPAHGTQSQEQWKLVLQDENDAEVMQTGPSSDIPDTAVSVVEIAHDSVIIPALVKSVHALHNAYPLPPDQFNDVTPVCAAFDRIDLPPGSVLIDEEAWAYDLQKVLLLWTNETRANTCLIPNDGKSEMNFRKSSLVKEAPTDYDVCTSVNYINSGATGADPTLLLTDSAAAVLEPDFTDTRLIYAEKPFDEAEKWILSEGESRTFSYRYAFSRPLALAADSVSCIAEPDIPEFSGYLADSLRLPAAVIPLIETELRAGFREKDGLRTVSLANPATVRDRIAWNINGEAAKLLPLFFSVSDRNCGEKRLAPATIGNQETVSGYEVGILDVAFAG